MYIAFIYYSGVDEAINWVEQETSEDTKDAMRKLSQVLSS